MSWNLKIHFEPERPDSKLKSFTFVNNIRRPSNLHKKHNRQEENTVFF